MHILYVHQNFPAQFGHIAQHLVQVKNWRCTFISQTPAGNTHGIEKIQYQLAGGATATTNYCSRSFENAIWHCQAVYDSLAARPDIQPDLIVGHSGFGSTLFLPELYPTAPIINLFEYYYRTHDIDNDMDFRADLGWPVPPIKYLRSRARNAMMLLDLQTCTRAYVPTEFQRSRFPERLQSQLNVIFDGVDRAVYHGHEDTLRPPPDQRTARRIAGVAVAPTTRVVTYVSRGFESMRGFDLFMRIARRITAEYPDVLFLIVGSDRIAYGGDEEYLDGKTFKQWVLSKDEYDLDKFKFLGRLPRELLGTVLASSDLHIYLTVPFVLSWSMMDAMSCGATVLASATGPVTEMITDRVNGLLADFFDIETFVKKAVAVLKDPIAFRPLGRAAEALIKERYSLEAVMPSLLNLYNEALANAPSAPSGFKPGTAKATTEHPSRAASPFLG